MRFKDDSIRPGDLSPQLLLALIIIDDVYKSYNEELVITSLNDGRHSITSLHYAGQAVDIRTRNVPQPTRALLVERIKERLTSDYDVILESDHLHVEYQPRRPE